MTTEPTLRTDDLIAVATGLADAILDRPFGDPDDDLAKLARAFFRRDWSASLAATPEPAPRTRVVADLATGKTWTEVTAAEPAPSGLDARRQEVIEAVRALNRLVRLLPSTARVHDDYRIITDALRASTSGDGS